MGSHECPKVLPCLATGTEVRGTRDQVIFVLGWLLGFSFVVVLFGFFRFCFLFCCFVLWGFSLVLYFLFVWVLVFFFFYSGLWGGKTKQEASYIPSAGPPLE